MRRVCAWCGRELGDGRETASPEPLTAGNAGTGRADSGPGRDDLQISHGMCPDCMASFGAEAELVETLWHLTEAEADTLPLGRMLLASDGTVLQYNAAEETISGRDRSRVVGRHFFHEVAPCTRVREFEGRFQEMVAAGQVAVERFDFRFRFSDDRAHLRDAQVVFVHDPPVGMLVLVMIHG